MTPIVTHITQPPPLVTTVSRRSDSIRLGEVIPPIVVTQVTPPGTAGGAAQISADQDNQLTQGSDQKLFVPGDNNYDYEALVAAVLSI